MLFSVHSEFGRTSEADEKVRSFFPFSVHLIFMIIPTILLRFDSSYDESLEMGSSAISEGKILEI